ncbi:aldehyde dehydrogenase family protein [Streptomyces sp. NP160]|uniref:aldehyde dehydrogenase family protein n=1 Tax=Streptomyces sp. NP160 TaxID=2586637 RepID=UPI00214ABA26|nr:aldehyde dehydrogenase family protein [Streptomyces sp. NP160]
MSAAAVAAGVGDPGGKVAASPGDQPGDLSGDLPVRDKYTGHVLATVPQHTAEDAAAAVRRGSQACRIAAALPRHQRTAILEGAATRLLERSEEVASLLVAEAGKTIRQARKEVSRAVNTLRLSAAEAARNAGEVVPFDTFPGAEGRRGWYTREPLGLLVAITPYNDPLNLVALSTTREN